MFYFLMHLLPSRNAFLFSPVNWVSWRALVCLVLTVKQFWRLVGTRIAMPPGSIVFFTFWLAICSRAPRSSSKRDHQEFCWVQCPVYSLCYSQRASEGWPGQVQWQVFFPCCVLGGLLCGVLHECSFWFHFALQSEKGDFDVGYCFWKEATVSHITDVPVANVLSLSGKDVEKLSRSQFSLSVGGTPTFRKPTTPHEMYFVSNSSWWRLSSTPSATRSAKLMCSSAKRLTWGIPWALSHVVPLPSASLRWRVNLIFIFKMIKILLLCRRADLRRSWCSIVHRVNHQGRDGSCFTSLSVWDWRRHFNWRFYSNSG